MKAQAGSRPSAAGSAVKEGRSPGILSCVQQALWKKMTPFNRKRNSLLPGKVLGWWFSSQTWEETEEGSEALFQKKADPSDLRLGRLEAELLSSLRPVGGS